MAWVSKRKAADGSARYVANYRDPTDAKRSAGTFRSRAEADRAGHAAEIRIREGSWVDRKAGQVTFAVYVQKSWWPSLQHLELTTKAAYRSNLDAHFLPYFGKYPMNAIAPTVVQGWVAKAVQGGLSPRSVRKYHTMLHSIFKAAVRDRVIAYNPCEGSNLPKVITPGREFISPEQFEKLLLTIPDRDQLLLLVGIETGMRWGELVALRPRHLDLTQCLIVVRETIVEISKKNSPTGQRYQIKPYPKSNKPRVIKIGQELTELIADRIATLQMGPEDLLFPSTDRDLRQPTSRNTFRTRSWRPAVQAADLPLGLRMHDLRHAHASWLLAGGADLKTVMDRLGHARIATTQQYLHALAGADDTALAAFRRIRDRHRPAEPAWEPDPEPEPPEYDPPGP